MVTMIYYRVPLTAQSVYDGMVIRLNLATGLPGPRGTTWLPPFAEAPQDADFVYMAMREEHYLLPEIKAEVDQTIATTWMEQITAEQYYEALTPTEDDDPDPQPSIPAWVQPTGAHDAYGIGDKVTHDGKTWESTAEANIWEPGVFGWEEIQ